MSTQDIVATAVLWEDEIGQQWMDGWEQDEVPDRALGRRLAVTMAEACRAGVPWRVFVEIFVEWARVARPYLDGVDRAWLDKEIAFSTALLDGKTPSACAGDGRADPKKTITTALSAANDSLAWLLCKGRENDPLVGDYTSAWHCSVVIIIAIEWAVRANPPSMNAREHHLTGVMEKLREIANERLWPRRVVIPEPAAKPVRKRKTAPKKRRRGA